MSNTPAGPEAPELFELDGELVRLDYVGAPEGGDDQLCEMMAETPGLFMPSMYSLTSVATGARHEFLVFGEGGVSPFEMAMHLAVSREGAVPVPMAPSTNASLTCEHGMNASLCAGPGHYPEEF